jgi:DNA-binding NtrC family response regulator
MEQEVTILIVDDEEAICSLLQKLLQRKGYQVLTAKDGAEALGLLERHSVTVVITDIVMPGMGGKDLLAAIKNKYPGVAVVMMTGYGDAFTIKQIMALGADEYVTKPFKGHEVSMIVERVVFRVLNIAPTPASLAE